MRFESLASSSQGNAYIVTDGVTRLLIECGVTHKKLQVLTGFTLQGISACLVSHEHNDHAKAVKQLQKDGMPLYMSEGTADALEAEGTETLRDQEQIRIGSMDIVPFATFHDAQEPLGFLIRSKIDGETIAFATDTVNLRYRFPGLTGLAIEANYDKDILERHDRIPDKVKHRITNTHMEIGNLCEYLGELELGSCKWIRLLHLSDASSREWDFVRRVQRAVGPDISVGAAKKMR